MTTAASPPSAVDLDAARRHAVDLSGWGRRFVFYQPRNLAFWAYLVLVGGGFVTFAQSLRSRYDAYGPAIMLAVTMFALYGAFFWWFTQRVDRYAKLPPKLMVTAFLWGGFAATWSMAAPANSAIADLYAKTFGQAWALDWSAGLSAPFTEELAKGAGLILLIALAPRIIRTAFDGLILGAFIGLGFQLIEDVSYALTSAAAHFGANQIGSSLGTIWLRMFTGVAAHVVYSAIFCAGLVYLMGRPAEPRRIGRGLLIIVAPFVVHGVWNSTGAISGASVLGQLGLMAAMIVITLVIVVVVFRLTVGRERELMHAVMAPEVASGILLAAEVDAMAGDRKARKRYRKAAPRGGERRLGRAILGAGRDLAAELAAARGADTERVQFARSEIIRIRQGLPSRW